MIVESIQAELSRKYFRFASLMKDRKKTKKTEWMTQSNPNWKEQGTLRQVCRSLNQRNKHHRIAPILMFSAYHPILILSIAKTKI